MITNTRLSYQQSNPEQDLPKNYPYLLVFEQCSWDNKIFKFLIKILVKIGFNYILNHHLATLTKKCCIFKIIILFKQIFKYHKNQYKH